MRRTNAEFFDELEAQMEREVLLEAARDTQQEIFDDALDLDPDDNDGDMSLEQLEGCDGEPLTMDDLIEGPNEHGFDRPSALRRDLSLLEENEQLRRQLDRVLGQYDAEFNAPERVAATQASLRDALYDRYGVLGMSEEGTNRLLAEMAAQGRQVHALNEDRINRSFSAAHERYGAEFEQEFESLSRASKSGNTTAQAIVRDIVNSADPGERFMSIVGNGWGGRRGGGTDLGALGLVGARTAPSRGGRGRSRDVSDEYDGFLDADGEREIFDSIWR